MTVGRRLVKGQKWRDWLAVVAVGLVLASLLGLRAPRADAASGDAEAVGLDVQLAADLGGVAVLRGSASAGSVAAPPRGDQRLLGVDAAGVGVQGGAAAVVTSASSTPMGSSARAAISGVDLRLFGLSAVAAETLEATADCPTFGSGDGTTTIASSGLTVLGQAVTVEADTPRTVTAGIDAGLAGLAGVTSASLTAVVTRTEVDQPTAARATAVDVAFTLTVSPLLGVPRSIDAGSVVLARASCEAPTPGPLSIGSLTPPAGPVSGGTPVTITGTGFAPGRTTVAFDGLAPVAAQVDEDGTRLTVLTPPSPTPGPVDVTIATPAQAATLASAFTYVDAGPTAAGSDPGAAGPVVTGIDPAGGPTSGGTAVTITGSGLEQASGVTFGGVAATEVTASPDGTRLSATTPRSETAGPVAVVVAGPGPLDAGTFTYGGPTIASLAPDRGPLAGGTRVTLTGSGLRAATAVTFAGRPGTDLVGSADGTSLMVTAPTGAVPGPVVVEVQLPGQDATAPQRYTYLEDGTGPAITGLDPDSGPSSGGTLVTITGRGLGGATAVRFGGVAGRDLVASGDGTRLTVTTPAGLPGSVPVAVALDPGTEVLGARQFTYQPAVAGASAAAPEGRSGAGLLARTGLPLLAVALMGAALATAGHLVRSRH